MDLGRLPFEMSKEGFGWWEDDLDMRGVQRADRILSIESHCPEAVTGLHKIAHMTIGKILNDLFSYCIFSEVSNVPQIVM